MILSSPFASPHSAGSGSVVVVVPHDGSCVPAQVPAAHASLIVHSSPSLQGLPFTSAAAQLSAASSHDSTQLPSPSAPGQGLPAWLLHDPSLQVSAPLQKAESSQAAVLFACAHTSEPSLQESVVHTFASPQSRSAPATQLPFWQASFTVQNEPSSQGVWSAAVPWVHSSACSSQASSVQSLASLQLRGEPAQVPPAHTSLLVQKDPSSQASVLSTWVQRSLSSSHASVVQALSSAQLRGVPEQTPLLQMPAVEQNWLLLQLCPSVFVSPGQDTEAPLQFSATSQLPVEARQTV